MPKLPSYQDIGNVSPTLKRDPGVTAPVQAFQSASGVLARELAPGLGFVADVVRIEEERKDRAKVNDSRRELLEFETEQTEWLSQQKGENVFNAKAQLSKASDARLAQIRAGLKNDRQRNAFREVEGDWRASFNRTSSRSIASEMDRHYDAVDDKLLESSSRAAQKAASLGEFDRVQTEWEDQEKVIAGYADRKGLDTTQRQARLDSRKSDFHSGVVKQLIADGNDSSAQKYLDANRKEFDANDIIALGKSLEIGNTRVLAQAFADKVDASGMSEAEAIKKARKEYSGQQEETVVLAIKQRFGERDQAVSRSQAAAADTAWDILAKTKSLDNVPPNVLNGMDGKVRLALEKEAQAIASGTAVKTNPNTYYDLQTMAVREPEKFQQIDLRQFFDKLDQGDREHFIKMQRPDNLSDAATLSQQLSNMHDQMGWGSSDKEKKGMFDKAVTLAIEEEQRRRGGKLSFKERQEVIDRMVLSGEVIRGRWYLPDPNRRMFQVYGTEEAAQFEPDIPKAEREKIEAALKRANRPITNEEVMRLFKRKHKL